MNAARAVPSWDAAGESLAQQGLAAQGRGMSGGFSYGFVAALSVLALGAAAPALAAGGISIPEPTDMTLIVLAVAGLIIGRRNGQRPGPDED